MLNTLRHSRKLLSLALAALAVFAAAVPISAKRHFSIGSSLRAVKGRRYYSSCGTIIDIDFSTGEMCFDDGHNLWTWYQDPDGFETGDSISVIFEERGRKNDIYDDRIVEVRYTPLTISGDW